MRALQHSSVRNQCQSVQKSVSPCCSKTFIVLSISTARGEEGIAITMQSRASFCRLASRLSSTDLAAKAAGVCSAIVEADAEVLQEANCPQEVLSIDLSAPEHYCSPIFWKVRPYQILTFPGPSKNAAPRLPDISLPY